MLLLLCLNISLPDIITDDESIFLDLFFSVSHRLRWTPTQILVQMWRLTVAPAHTKRVWKGLDYVTEVCEEGRAGHSGRGEVGGRELPEKEDKASSTEILLWLGVGPE